MNSKRSTHFLIFLILFNILFIDNITYSSEPKHSRWPIPDWERDWNSKIDSTKECIEFIKYSTQNKKLKTDGLLIIKDGLVEYEYYDSQNNPLKLHNLWSISKTITTSLLGVTHRDGRINLEDKLNKYFPETYWLKPYDLITIKNLIYFDTGYIWDETLLDVTSNPLVTMLFGSGHKNMVEYAINRNIIKQGPNYQWSYSSGTPMISMGVLKNIYNYEFYQHMPWAHLFNPLGINHAVFERDSTGTFIGGSGAFLNLRDLAKIGYLFLNNGRWNNQIILPPEWISIMLTPSPGYISPGTIIEDITDEGTFGGTMWLNLALKPHLGRPYPFSPEDMYLAIGFLGQVLIMLPSQNMIIARTGYDTNFNTHIDEFVSRAISCFDDPDYPVGHEILPLNKKRMGFISLIKNVKNALEANSLQGAVAKTICSCHLLSELDINTCLIRNNLSFSKLFSEIDVVKKNNFINGDISLTVKLSRFANFLKLSTKKTATAIYNPNKPENGCTLQ